MLVAINAQKFQGAMVDRCGYAKRSLSNLARMLAVRGATTMNAQTRQPWKPTCWVGGLLAYTKGFKLGEHYWIDSGAEQLSAMPDDSRAKYAATKATAAILRSMRK